MPIASIEKWTECPECGSGLEFDGYRENPLVCTGWECGWSEADGWRRFTDLMDCPSCGFGVVEAIGGFRENKVRCKSCGLVEGEMYDSEG